MILWYNKKVCGLCGWILKSVYLYHAKLIVSQCISFLVLGNVANVCCKTTNWIKRGLGWIGLQETVISAWVRSGCLSGCICSPESFLSRARLPKPERKVWFGGCRRVYEGGKWGDYHLLRVPLNPISFCYGGRKLQVDLSGKSVASHLWRTLLQVCLL